MLNMTYTYYTFPCHQQVTISGLNLQFQPNKLSHSVEEAKHIAAEHTISQLTCPTEGMYVCTLVGIMGDEMIG